MKCLQSRQKRLETRYRQNQIYYEIQKLIAYLSGNSNIARRF